MKIVDAKGNVKFVAMKSKEGKAEIERRKIEAAKRAKK